MEDIFINIDTKTNDGMLESKQMPSLYEKVVCELSGNTACANKRYKRDTSDNRKSGTKSSKHSDQHNEHRQEQSLDIHERKGPNNGLPDKPPAQDRKIRGGRTYKKA